MNKNIEAKELASYPAGTVFTTPDNHGMAYVLERATYGEGRVSVFYKFHGMRSVFNVMGLSSIKIISQ